MPFNLTNTANVTDNGTFALDGASGVTTAVVGGITYLFVASAVDDGVSVFSVAANGVLTNVFNITEADNAALELDGAFGVTTAVVSGVTYLFVAGSDDDGINVFSVAGNGALTSVDDVTDDPTLELDGVRGLATAVVGGVTYLFASGLDDDGVSVFSVAAGGALTGVNNVTDGGTFELDGAQGVATAVVGGNTYLFVAGFDDNGVSVFSVAAGGTLSQVDFVDDSEDAAFELAGAQGVATSVVGGVTYLFVAGGTDDGVSVFSVANDGTLTNVFNVTDAGILKLDGAFGLTTGVLDGVTYLFVTSEVDDGMTVFSVAANGGLTNVTNIPIPAVPNEALTELDGARGVTSAVIGGVTYVFAAGADDDGVSAFQLQHNVLTATARWFFPLGSNLDQPQGAEPAIDVGDLDGDGVLDPSPILFNGSNYNPDTMETVRVEVVVTNPLGLDATEVTYFLTEDGTTFFNLGIGPFTLPSGKSNTVTFETFIDRQTNQFVVPLLEQLRISYKYGGVQQTAALSDDITPQNPYLPGATDQTLVAADGLDLHGTVFNDANADSTFGLAEVGVANVAVNLYADTGTTVGVFNSSDAFLGSTTTDALGEYHFIGLGAGDYIVQVTAANFAAGQPLENLAVSSPGGVDPDNNVDNDDNGAPAVGVGVDGVVSLPIRLDYNLEPLDLIGPHIERVSLTSAGAQASVASADPSISGTGRYVAFASAGVNLVTGQVDINGTNDIFVYDRDLDTARLVSGVSGSTTVTGNGASSDADIADNGNFVAFTSGSTNLVAGQVDANGANDVFVFDRLAGTTLLVSHANGSATTTGNGISSESSISPEGRFIAFQSTASNLVATDAGGFTDVFLFDQTLGTTQLISLAHSNPQNVQGDAGSFNPSVSSNVFGRGVLVAFESDATNLLASSGTDTNGFRDIYVRDTDIVLETSRVSVGVGNVQSDGDSFNASISFDARFVAFESDASNLLGAGNDTNTVRDIFVAEINSSGNTIAIERVSRSTAGIAGDGASFNAAISADGRYVTFESDATNLLGPGVDTNGLRDVFVHDRVTHITKRVSVDDAGAQAIGGASSAPAISADGRIVSFQSGATNLLGAGVDTNGTSDVFAVTSLAGKDINTTLDFGFIDNAPPVVDATSGSGVEDQPTRIAIALSGTDPDGDTITIFTIETVSANGQIFDAATGGTLLTAGSTVPATGSGPYTATVYFQPAADFGGAASFTYSAFDGTQSGTAATASITLTATGDVSVTANDVSGTETDATVTIALDLSTAITDVDGSETLTNVVVDFTGAPAGLTAATGVLVDNGGGSYTLTLAPGDVAGASITVPADFAGTFSGSAVANSNEGSSTADTFDVNVAATAEAVTANDISGVETDSTVTIALDLSVHADADGSETLTDVVVTFTGAPAGMTATGGTLVGNVLTIPAANVGTASITVPADFAGSFTGSAVANSDEGSSAADSFNVSVAASGDVSVTASDVSGVETNAPVTIALSLSTLIDDIDGSETLTNVVVDFTGAPVGLTASSGVLADNGGGSYTLTLAPADIGFAGITVPADFSGNFTGSAVANSNEGASAADGFNVSVAASGDVLVTANDVSGTETDAAVTVALSLSTLITDVDSSETLTNVVVNFTGAPAGLTAATGVLVDNTGGSFTLTLAPADVAGASITVPADFAGSFTGSAVANSNEGASAVDGFNVSVAASGDVSVTANDIAGVETDAPVTIALSLSTLIDDIDGSETLTNVVVDFTGAPVGLTAPTGALVDNGGGSYTLTLAPADVAGASITVPTSFAGSFTGSAVANSNEGASAADGFNVSVGATGDVSVIANDVSGTETDAAVTVALSLSTLVTDPDGSETLTNVVVDFTGAPAGLTAPTGVLVDNGGGSYTLTLAPADVAGASITVPADFAGSFAGSAVANSNEGASAADGFNVSVAASGDVSVTANDVAGAETNAPVTIALSLSSLIDDVDGSETLTNIVVGFTGAPAGLTATAGVLVDNGGGSYSLTLTPAQVAGASITVPANFAGSFSGSAVANSNEGVSAADGFTVSVTATNDAPGNTVPGPQTVAEDTNVAITGLAISDIDAGTGSLSTTLSVAQGTLTVLSAGGALVSGSGTTSVILTGTVAQINTTLAAAGNVIYRGALNFNGSDSLTVLTNDGGNTGSGGAATDTDTVSITVTPVNDPPIANDDALSSIAEDSGVRTIAFSALTGNDLRGAMNEGGQTLTVVGVSNPTGGTVAIVGGAVEFTPTANFNGAASFDYTVRDNGLTNGVADFKTDVGQATFAITPVNDAPVNTVPVAQTTIGGGRVFSSANGNAISVADVDAAGGSETVVLDALHGTLTLASTAGLTVSGNASGHVQLAGTLANINAALNGLAYQATSSAFPTDTLTIASNDNGNSGAGGALSDQDTVLLSLNRPPVAANDASALIWHIATTGNVLANDSDPDAGDSLAVAQFAFGATSAVAGGALAGTYGTLTVSADGTFKYIATRGNLTVGQSASDHFSYTVSDSHGASAAASLDFSVTDTVLSELIGTQTSHLGGFNGELVRLYDTAFDRVADEAGLIGWINTLKAGASLNQVANAFAGSGEFVHKFGVLNNHDFVDQIYHNALSRDADDDPGSAGWINALNQGLDRGAVLLGISDSAEHKNDTQVSPLTDGFAPNENASAVGRLYYGLLNRAPDAGGLQDFTSAVENGTPLKQVAQVMISSDEFNFRFPSLSNHDYVDHLYQDALGRDVDNDASGQGWIDALNLGAARADVAVGIAESPEAHSHLDPFLEKGYLLA